MPAKSLQLCAMLRTVAHRAPLSMGFSRQEYWRGLACPSPGDLLSPGTEPKSYVLPLVPPGKPHTGLGCALNPMTDILYKRWGGGIKIQTQRNIRRRQCESGGRHWGEAASSWRTNAKAGQRSSRVRGDFRGSMALLTPWPQTSSLQNCGRINFYCFKPAVVWYFVFAALGTNILSKGNNWKNRIIIQTSPMTGYGPVAVLLFLTPEQNLCFWCMRACRVSQSCPTLCNPKDCSPPGSSVHGMSKARILEWVAMPSSRGSSQSRDRTHISCIGRWVLYPWDTMKCSWYPLSELQQNSSLLTKLY